MRGVLLKENQVELSWSLRAQIFSVTNTRNHTFHIRIPRLFHSHLINVAKMMNVWQCLLTFLDAPSHLYHPSPDNPQKKNQNHHLGDPKIYQVDGVGYPKKQVAKSLQGTFFNKINLKTL